VGAPRIMDAEMAAKRALELGIAVHGAESEVHAIPAHADRSACLPACEAAAPAPPPITDRQWLRRPTIFTPAMSPLPPAPAPIPPCASSHHASVALTRHSMWADMWRVGSGRGQIALAAAEALAEVLVTHAEIVRGGVAPPRQVCTA
jgi:hypothetical protein